MFQVNFNAIALAVVCVIAVGCDHGETLGKVHGNVTFQGEPVAEGILVFSNREKGVHMTAELSADGSYELQMAQGFGLPLGTYEVAVNPPILQPPIPGKPGPPPKMKAYDNIPHKYFRPETSGLRVTVVEGDNPFDIDMKLQP